MRKSNNNVLYPSAMHKWNKINTFNRFALGQTTKLNLLHLKVGMNGKMGSLFLMITFLHIWIRLRTGFGKFLTWFCLLTALTSDSEQSNVQTNVNNYLSAVAVKRLRLFWKEATSFIWWNGKTRMASSYQIPISSVTVSNFLCKTQSRRFRGKL